MLRTIGNMDFFKYEVEEAALTAQSQKAEGIREKGFDLVLRLQRSILVKKPRSGVSKKNGYKLNEQFSILPSLPQYFGQPISPTP